MSRILLLVPRMNIGGAETYVYTVAKELHRRGEHTIFVASAGGKLAEELESLGIKTFFVPIRFSKKLAVFLLKRIIKKYNIDLVHANSGAAGIVATLLKRETSIPVVYSAHGRFGNIEREYIINEVDKIICVSNFVRNRALGQNFDADKLITRYSGVDIKRFSPNTKIRAELREEYNIGDETLVLITASRIKNLEHKGHQEMVDLFADYAREENWKLFILGKGNGIPMLKLEIQRRGLQDKIICLGHHTDVENYLNMGDLYISATHAETFGLAIAEGMAMGKPAVVYEVGGTPEVVSVGQSGYLVKHKNVRDMYEKIKMFDENRKLLNDMSKSSRQWVLDNFTNTKMVDELEMIYEEVLFK